MLHLFVSLSKLCFLEDFCCKSHERQLMLMLFALWIIVTLFLAHNFTICVCAFVSFVLCSVQMGLLCDQGSWMWVRQIINNSATHPEICVLDITNDSYEGKLMCRMKWLAEGHSIKCLNSACHPGLLTSKACFFSNQSLGNPTWHRSTAGKKAPCSFCSHTSTLNEK